MGKRIDEELLIKYFKENKKDSEIAVILGCGKDGIFAARKRLKLVRSFKFSEGKDIKLTKEQEEILIGHLLGDGHMSKIGLNPRVKIEQGERQKEYAYWKYLKFINLSSTFKEYKRKTKDKRNGNIYISYGCYLGANPNFLKYYNLFYKDKVKIISEDIFEYYTDLSLAVHFMDDGYKLKSGYGLATNCFSLEEIKIFQRFLWNKFKIETTIHTGNRIYVKSGSKRVFEEIISPYILDSMRYKLHNYSLLTPLNGETPMARTIPC